MRAAAGIIFALIVVACMGYYAGMRHYDVAAKDAAIEALSTSVTAESITMASHKRANKYLVDQLKTLNMAWGIYEKDNLDRCARTAINDPRLAWLLVNMSEGNQIYSHPAPDGAFDKGEGTGPQILWTDVGKYAVEGITAFRACDAKIESLIEYFTRVGAKPASDIGNL